MSVELVGTGPKKAGTFTLSVEWSANTLDGQPTDGVREIAFDVMNLPDRDADVTRLTFLRHGDGAEQHRVPAPRRGNVTGRQ